MASVAQIVRRRRNRRNLRHQARQRGRMWSVAGVSTMLVLVVFPLVVIVGVALLFYVRGAQLLPLPEETIYLDPIVGATELYDREGQILLFSVQDPLGDERTWLPLAEMPPYLVEATLLVEDPDFMQTARFDALQTMTDLWGNFLEWTRFSFSEWADLNLDVTPITIDNTLTGRLVHNTILGAPEFATYDGRALEIAMVAEINRLYSTEEVLEWHLNTNYYGNEAYGIEAAARVYLGRRAADLSLAEVALLAAIPSASQYNPLDNEQAAFGRQRDVLRALAANGAITQEQYTAALNTAIVIETDTVQAPQVAPEFAVYARRQAENILDLQGRDGARLVARGGLRIITTLDLDLYYQSECALRLHLARLNGSSPALTTLTGQQCTAALNLAAASPIDPATAPNEGMLVVLDATSGELLSIVGAAARTAYQPGVTLHPFVYFQGFGSALYHPSSMMLDISQPFPGAAEGLIYVPANRDGQYRGPISLREAMALGRMPPVTTVTNAVQLSNVLVSAHQIGLNSLFGGEYDLSLLERGGEVSVLDVAYSYSVFATMGQMYGVQVEPIGQGFRVRDPVAVLRIEDAEGNVLWEYDELARQPTLIFDSSLAYLVNDILADRETRWSLLPQNNVLDLVDANNVARPVAVVNGITANNRDSWTIGYTPQIVTGVRLGRSDGEGMALDTYNLTGAAPVWRAVMDYTHTREALPVTDWQRPDSILTLQVCQISGLLPNGVCPVRDEIFRAGVQPFQQDTYWQAVVVNSETGQLATSSTSAALRVTRTYFVPPSNALDWWRANGQPLPPTEYDSVSRPAILSSAAILQPAAFAYVGGLVDIRGSLDTAQMQYYQLAYGEGVNPAQWIAITGQETQYTPGTSLGTWNTAGLDGIYTLRLQMVLLDNMVETSTVYVTVDNIAPTVTLNAGTDESGAARIYRLPGDDVVTLEAVAEDNLALAYVEFYHNGEYLGRDDSHPFSFEWAITRAGSESFTAVAFDRVGNSSGAEITVEIVRAG